MPFLTSHTEFKSVDRVHWNCSTDLGKRCKIDYQVFMGREWAYVFDHLQTTGNKHCSRMFLRQTL